MHHSAGGGGNRPHLDALAEVVSRPPLLGGPLRVVQNLLMEHHSVQSQRGADSSTPLLSPPGIFPRIPQPWLRVGARPLLQSGPRLGPKHVTTIVASHPTLCQRACTYELPCPHHQSPHSQPRFHSSTQHAPLASDPKSQDNPVMMGNHLERLLHVLDRGWHSRNRLPAPPPHHTLTLPSPSSRTSGKSGSPR